MPTNHKEPPLRRIVICGPDIEQRCLICQSPFIAKSRRSWCSDECYRVGRQRAANGKGVSASVAAGKIAEAVHDEKVERSLSRRVNAWYRLQRMKRAKQVMESTSENLEGTDDGQAQGT